MPFSNNLIVFLAVLFLVSALLFLFPINLFDGEIVLQSGVQKQVIQAPLSLSYFIGMGYDEKDLEGVKTFYLLPKGYALAIALLVGIPAMVTYRIHLGRTKKANEKNN